MHRLKVAISGTSKSVSKIPPNPRWIQADAVFRQIESPALEVEAALLETTQAWSVVARSAGAFSEALLKVPVAEGPGLVDDTFGELSAELDSQVADAGETMMEGLEKVRESHSLLLQYCQKIRSLQEYRKGHEKAMTEAAYYSEKVDKVRDSQLKKKKSTEAELEKLKRNEDKLRACNEQVEETETMFVCGVEFLVRNKAIVFDRVLVGYIVGQSAIMDSNPFRGLSTSVQADFSTILATPLDAVDLDATTAGTSTGLAGIPSAFDDDTATVEGSIEGANSERVDRAEGFAEAIEDCQTAAPLNDNGDEPIGSLVAGGSVTMIPPEDVSEGAVLQPEKEVEQSDVDDARSGPVTSPISVTE